MIFYGSISNYGTLSRIREQDHSISLIEAWMEASLDSLFDSLNALNDQMQTDRETRAELAGLGRFVEAQFTGGTFEGSEAEVVQEAKERFGRVRERLLSASSCL